MNPNAPSWRPSIVLRPPPKPKPFQIASISVDKPFNLIEFMERLYQECMMRFSTLSCSKVFIHLNYHPDYLKKADEAFLVTSHPAIRITIQENEYIDFFYRDQRIWPLCNVGFRAPLGANLYYWSVKDLYKVLDGIDRLINRCYPDIFPSLSLF